MRSGRAARPAGLLGSAPALLVLSLLLLGPSLPRAEAAAPPPEDPARLARVLERLDQNARGLKSLAGTFTQKSRIKLFKGQELTSRGRFYFERPRRIRWEYLEPDPSVLLLDGDKVTLTTPGAAPQVFDLKTDVTMRAIFDQLTLWLGSGALATAGADYAMAAAGTDEAPSLVLTPRPGTLVAKAFARIELRFDKRLLLSSIDLREVNGDEKEITFSKMERDKIPADAFKP